MSQFRYLRDPLFLACCALYALNRWALAPHSTSLFLRGYFNDLLLIPCALPPLLWAQRQLALRTHDGCPTLEEIALNVALWSVVCEWIGPSIFQRATGDPWDVLAYASGALISVFWWRDKSQAVVSAS